MVISTRASMKRKQYVESASADTVFYSKNRGVQAFLKGFSRETMIEIWNKSIKSYIMFSLRCVSFVCVQETFQAYSASLA
mmetsp:Transcript_8203/g.10376  ORF Transcript_8203/g.10376 Transcript_8203/m.10376 type:complete len:80 (-) Transcript_8203:132-371(-)